MKRAQKLLIWGAGVALFLAALLVVLGPAWQTAVAAPVEAEMELDPIVIVADTTATMGPELNALAAAYNFEIAQNASPDASRLYHLIGYKNQPNYLGSTADAEQFHAWLSELNPALGGDCEDAMLQALLPAARNVPDSRALVVSDASPIGERKALIATINRLVQRGVQVYPLISDWCADSELTESSMFMLARMTGGFPFVVEQADVPTATVAALKSMQRSDNLILDNTAVDGVKTYDLLLDSTATTLGVDTYECPRVWCLTCTRSIAPVETIELQGPAVEIVDPYGNVLSADHPGVTMLQTSSGTSYEIDVREVITVNIPPPLTSTWQVRVNWTGDLIMSASADSGLHFDYLGRALLRAGKTIPFRVSLMTDEGEPPIDAKSLTFGLVGPNNELGMTFELFDDGQHLDGEAGDGIYGGPVTPPKGFWYPVVRGELEDGTSFQRIDPVMLRVKGFNLTGPADSKQLPGSSMIESFTLTNENEESHTYELLVTSSQGWAVTDTAPVSVTLAAGESRTFDVPVEVPADATDGEVEETAFTAVDILDLAESDTAVAQTTVVDQLFLYLPAVVKP